MAGADTVPLSQEASRDNVGRRASRFVERGMGFQPVFFTRREEFAPLVTLLKSQIMLRGSMREASCKTILIIRPMVSLLRKWRLPPCHVNWGHGDY